MKTILIVLSSFFAFFATAEPHTWTFQNGDKFSGEYFSSGQEKVVVTIKISDLSETDQAFVVQQKAAAKKQKPTNQCFRIISILDEFGQCNTSEGRIYIYGIPQSVKDYIARYYQLKAQIPTAEDNAEKLRHDAARADANAATGAYGDSSYVNSTMAPRYRAENLRVDADEAADELKKLKDNYKEMEAGLIQNTSVAAFPMGTKHNGLDEWKYVGLAFVGP